jgi:SAM-dependent methyltransferase
MTNVAPQPSLHDEITREYYRTTAVRGHAPTPEHYRFTAAQLQRRLRDWLPRDPNARCLDLACGCGEMLYLLEQEGIAATTGVDLSREELDNARIFVRGRLVHDDVLEFLQGEPDGSYDFVSALNFLEHLPKDKLLAILTEAGRVLAPNGTLVVIVPNAISPFAGTTRHWDLTHEWAFTPNNFRQLAALSGFDAKVELRECRPVAHGFISGVRVIAWALIRTAISAWLLVETADRKGGVYTMDMMVRLRRQLQ